MIKRTILKIRFGVIVLLAALICRTATARIIYVDDDANGVNNGLSWADAYDSLQDALADANSSPKPVEIRVAQGIYKPDRVNGIATGHRTATFQLINGVAIKGGYAGFGEPDPGARDVEGYKSILSGDLRGNDVEVDDPCDLLNEPTRAENSYHVLTGSGTDATAVLGGFTITGGNANSSNENRYGGAMYNRSCRSTICDCTFTANSARVDGGGIYNAEGSCPTLINCTLSSNSTRVDSPAAHGGGIYNCEGSNPTLINCRFSDNSAGDGGGMYNHEASSPILTNCTFTGNSARMLGGGGMHDNDGRPILTNCTFRRNSANDKGGAMYSTGGSPILINCIFSANCARRDGGAIRNHASRTTLANCVFTGNRGASLEGSGGAMANSHSNVALNNCTFAANYAPKGSALACDSYPGPYPSGLHVTNCILWDAGSEIYNNDGSTITITYSDVQRGWKGEGNIDSDPYFADPCNSDYYLKSQAGRWDTNEGRWTIDQVTSPCIDAGDPMSLIGDEPFPNGGIVNMGAYGGTAEASKSYFGEPICETIVAGDINGDCKVNFLDFRLIALHWLWDN